METLVYPELCYFFHSLIVSNQRSTNGAEASTPHLHSAEPHPDGGRRALLTLADLIGLLLLGRVVTVLPGPHLQVQDAGHGVAPRQVLQEDEFCGGEVKDHSRDGDGEQHRDVGSTAAASQLTVCIL